MDDEKNLSTSGDTPNDNPPEITNATENQPAASPAAGGVSLDKPASPQEEMPKTATPENATEPVVSEPVYVDGAPALAATPAPKKNNRGLIAGLIILVVVAAIGVLAGPKLFASPLAKVAGAFAATAENTQKAQSVFEQATGIGAAYQAAESGKSKIDGQLTIENFTGYEEMSGLGLYYQIDTDMPGKLAYMDLGLMMDTARLVDIEMYANNETAAFAVPDIINGYFSMPLKNIGAAYKASIFNRYQPMDIADDYSLSFFDETLNNVPITALSTKHIEWGKRLQKEITAEKTDKADLPVGDTTVSCQGYKISMADDKATAYLHDYVTFWESDPDAQATLDELIAASAAQNSYSTGMSPQALEQQLKQQFSLIFTEMKEMQISNLAYHCYVDDKGLLRKTILTATLTYQDEPLEIEFDTDLTGTSRAADEINASLHMTVDDETISMHFFNKEYLDNEKVMIDGGFLLGDEYTDLINSNWTLSYNTSDNAYDFSGEINVEDEGAVLLTSTGLLEIPQKGKSFQITMDSIKMTIDGLEDENVTLSGSFGLSELADAVKVPSGTEYKLFELDESTLQSLVFEAYGNVMRLASEFSDIFQ